MEKNIKNLGCTTECIINADYVAGLIEADGCFTIGISKKNYFAVHVSISSLTNTNTLGLIKSWLEIRGINSSLDIFIAPECIPLRERVSGVPYSRCNLKIDGNKQIEKFLNILEKEVTSDFLFCGVKQRDYLLVRAFFALKTKQQESSPELSKPFTFGRGSKPELSSGSVAKAQAQRLAIKKSMHKSNYLQQDSRALNITTREVLEVKLGLGELEKSYKMLEILQNVDYQYSLHQSSITQAITEKTLKVSPSFIAGVIDGDGSFYITVSWKEPNASYNKRHISWEGCFTLSTDKNSYLLFDLLKYVFNLPTILQVKALLPTLPKVGKVGLKTSNTKDTTGALGSYQIWVRNQAQISFMLSYLSGKLCGNYRILQYNSVCKLFHIKNAGFLKNKIKNIEIMKDLLREIYTISAISKKGSLRNPATVEQALYKTDIWFIS